MAVTYSYAPEVRRVAEVLIADHRPDLREFGAVRIEYVFRSESAKEGGREVWGKARKVSGLAAFLAGPREDAPEGRPGEDDIVEPLFVVEIAHDVWVTLSRKQRLALVDHQLAHCQVVADGNGDPVLKLRGHDVAEFVDVVARHGVRWRPDVEHFAKVAADQLSLLDEPADDDIPAADPDTGEAEP